MDSDYTSIIGNITIYTIDECRLYKFYPSPPPKNIKCCKN